MEQKPYFEYTLKQLKEDILKKAKEIRDANFLKNDTSSVPTIFNSKLTFGCTGLNLFI